MTPDAPSPIVPSTPSRFPRRPAMGEHPPVTDWATDFDHTDEGWAAGMYSVLTEIRASECPVAHTDRYGGVWLPTKHADVSAIAYDTEHFTSRSIVVSEVKPP